jgi:adenylate cyclase
MRKLLAGLAIGIGSSAVVLLLGWAGWLERAELVTYDWRLRVLRERSPQVHPGIVLVEINDTTIGDLKDLAGRWPWPRALSALVIDFLHRGAPKAIAVDIGFWEPERQATYTLLGDELTGELSDARLAESVKRAGNVILLVDAVNPGTIDSETGGRTEVERQWTAPAYRLDDSIEPRPEIALPYDGLDTAAAGFGHNYLRLDPDGIARRILPFVRKDRKFIPSLGVAAALMAAGVRPEEVESVGGGIRVRDHTLPLVAAELEDVDDPSRRHDQQTLLINYRAPALVNGQRPYPVYEVQHLLQSEGQILSGEPPPLDPAVFKDKVVFVGLHVAGFMDVFPTPLGRNLLPGIQLHASVADSVMTHLFIRPGAGWTAIAAVLCGALIVGLMSASLPYYVAAGGTVLLAAGWTGTSFAALDRGLWLAFAQPLLATAIALFAGTAYRFFVEDAEKRKVSRLFGRFVSRDVYRQLMAHPDLAELGGARREMSVLFSDLRGFTTITEAGHPEELVRQLNEYFSRMVEIVFRNGGTVDKFVGDMVMALFGAPVDDVNHADSAVRAAVEMVRELGELNKGWAAEGRVPLDIGIGVNSGDMIAGNIGSSSIMSYTVIGDNVNLGARLESLNKEYRTRIIISEATRHRLGGRYETRPLGAVVVKGKTRPVEIFEVIAPSPLVSTAAGAAGTEERTV